MAKASSSLLMVLACMNGYSFVCVLGGWIDPATPVDKRSTVGLSDGLMYDLVMSDEFNLDGRRFQDGEDR